MQRIARSWPLPYVTCSQRTQRPNISCRENSTISWQRTAWRIPTSKASWRTVHRPIRMLSESSMAVVIQRSPWRTVSALISSTGPWTTSLKRHTQKFIKSDMHDQHSRLCKQYKDFKTMDEAESRYLAIRAWWLSLGAASEDAIRDLNL
jgi:hypothetical protein